MRARRSVGAGRRSARPARSSWSTVTTMVVSMPACAAISRWVMSPRGLGQDTVLAGVIDARQPAASSVVRAWLASLSSIIRSTGAVAGAGGTAGGAAMCAC